MELVKYGHGDQQNRILSSEINLCVCGQLIFSKSAKTILWGGIVFSANGAGIPVRPHAKTGLSPNPVYKNKRKMHQC